MGSDQGVQGSGEVAPVLDNMDVLSGGVEFIGLDRGQTAADHDSLGVMFLGQMAEVPALGGCGVRHAAGVDDDQLRLLRGIHLPKAVGFEKLANLLAFVVVDLAAES